MNEFQKLEREIRKFVNDREWDEFHNSKSLVLALAGECGELADIFRWIAESESDDLHTEELSKVKSEIADVFIFLVLLSSRQNIDLLQVVREKLKLNSARYPQSKSKGSALKYTKL